jgi:uncharacterized protein YdbL (DUF1318 family)
VGAALLATACVAVTINVTFPQEKIDSAAADIEDMVRGPKEPGNSGAPPATPPATPTTPKEPRGAVPGRGGWRAWFLPTVVEAQEAPRLKTRTPEVNAAIESRRGRYAAVRAAMAQGCLGETARGLIEAREGQDCPANLPGLIKDENRDRMFLYRTIVEQNNMPPEDLARVEAGFARAHRDRAVPGSWLQDDSGRWYRK